VGLLIGIHVFLCLALIGIILLQPGKSDMGIGFGSSSQSIFGSKGAGNLLTKATATAAALFLITSFTLTRIRVVETSGTVTDIVAEDLIPSAKPKTDGTEKETPKVEPGHEGHNHGPGEGHDD